MVRRQFRDVRGGQGAPPGRRRHAPAPRELQEADALSAAGLLAELRAADHDRYVAGLWAPAASRGAWAAVHLLDLELARIAVAAREPTLAAIKLAWWRERLEALAAGGEPPAQPLLRALAAERGRYDISPLLLLEDAWLPLLEHERPDWAAHARTRGAALFRALGGGGEAGAAWAAGRCARGELGVPAEGAVLDAVAGLAVAAAGAAKPDASQRPLLGLARLGARDVGRAQGGLPPERAGSLPRQWLLARTALFG